IEGLLVYLESLEVEAVLRQTAELACAGSRLTADLPSATFLELPWTRQVVEAMAAAGAPWRFGIDEPEAFFANFGWKADVLLPGDEGVHFGRWPYPRFPRSMPGVPHSFFVHATK